MSMAHMALWHMVDPRLCVSSGGVAGCQYYCQSPEALRQVVPGTGVVVRGTAPRVAESQ